MLNIPMALFKQLPVGTKITGRIGSTSNVEGRLSYDGIYHYFCQDRVNGKETPDKLGHLYSYAFQVRAAAGGMMAVCIAGSVELDSIIIDASCAPSKPMEISGYEIGLFDDYIMFGTTKVKHTTIAKIAKSVKAFKE